jgi:dual specificity tyrosine-phosphorylation-regulated kinase 2/3/4
VCFGRDFHRLIRSYLGIPIFPGENEFDQLNYIMEYLGVPPENIILSAKKKDLFFDEELNPIKKENSKGKIRLPNTKKFEDFLDGAEEDLIDLIKVCLNLFRNV